MELPDDLRAFLSRPENRTLPLPGCQIQEATLFAPDELREVERDVGTSDFALQEGWDDWDQAPRRHFGYRAVDLVKACHHYSPSGIMLWLPDLGVYGQWDRDHHKIIAFPGASWSDIARDPSRYFDAMWGPERVAHEYLRPWE